MLFRSSFPEIEIVRYAGELASFIKARKEFFEPDARPLSDMEQVLFAPFFSEAILKTTLFVRKTDGPIETPDLLKELDERGLPFSLGGLRAVTFVDVVVAYDDLDPRVQFHELVHAVQYQKLGLKQFANKYIRGLIARGSYEKIPLEANARLLDEAYSKNPTQPFSVEQEVQRWINENKF